MDRTTRQNRVREALGRIYEQQPPYFREYLRRYQEDPTSRVFAPLAEAYRRLGRVDEAIEICLEGLEHHPDFHGGRVALAKCYVDKKNYSEARTELEKVVNAVPENLLAQRILGDVFTALKDARQALHCYKMALLLSPSDVALADKVHSLEHAIDHGDSATFGKNALISEAQDEDDDDSPPFWESSAADAVSSPASLDRAKIESVPEPAPFVAEPTAVSKYDDPVPAFDDQGASDEPSPVDDLLGVSNGDPMDEAFKIEHVSAIFAEQVPERRKEITTETLGDLYFSQGQFDRALRIYEKLHSPGPELRKKITACRAKLGVDHDSLVRARQTELLKSILRKVRD